VLGPAERLDFERRRLPLRLALFVAPVFILISGGPAAPSVATHVAAIIGLSSLLIWALLRYAPASLLCYQLGLRILDVVLVFTVLTHLSLVVSSGQSFDFVYILTVVAATATHGWRGNLVASSASTVAVIAGRIMLAKNGVVPLNRALILGGVFNSIMFFISGSMIEFLMRMSATIVEQREAVLRGEIEKRNQALERSAAQLAAANSELETFVYSVSHDLRAPLRSIDGFSRVLLSKYLARLDAEGQDYLERVRAATQRMGQLIDDVLALSRVTLAEMRREPIDLSRLAEAILGDLATAHPDRAVDISIAPGLRTQGDPVLLRAALENLLTNAWKFSGKVPRAKIEFASMEKDGRRVYYVRDNGAGFDMAYADKLFGVFQRLHSTTEFEGTGVGLATVQRILRRHGGTIWADARPGEGATFFFTL
jgi:signal transduction histidine kinase